MIGSRSHPPHCDCRSAPVCIYQVVALPVQPSCRDKVLAVNAFPATNLVGGSRKLRKFFKAFSIVLTSSKASPPILMPSAFTDFLTASWRAISSRLWMASLLVRLFTLMKGSFSLSFKVPFSRLMKASKAPSKSFRITSFCSLVTSQPMVSSTAGMFTSFPNSCGDGILPAQVLALLIYLFIVYLFDRSRRCLLKQKAYSMTVHSWVWNPLGKRMDLRGSCEAQAAGRRQWVLWRPQETRVSHGGEIYLEPMALLCFCYYPQHTKSNH